MSVFPPGQITPITRAGTEVNVTDDLARDMPILYSFRRCPFAMRARLAIVASGLKVQVREIVLRDKPQHMLELSPKGTVPVLSLPDGKVLEQSLEIMQWALGHSDPHGLTDLNPLECVQSQQIVELLDGDFKQHLDRYKYPERYLAKEAGFDRMHHRTAGVETLSRWSASIELNGHLIGKRLTWVDLAVLPFVRQFRIPEPDWFDALPQLAALSKRLAQFVESDWFEAAMVKLTPWKPGDPSTVFPA